MSRKESPGIFISTENPTINRGYSRLVRERARIRRAIFEAVRTPRKSFTTATCSGPCPCVRRASQNRRMTTFLVNNGFSGEVPTKQLIPDLIFSKTWEDYRFGPECYPLITV